MATHKEPAQANNFPLELLDFDDHQEFDFATRGRIAAPDALEICNANAEPVWTQKAYHFVEQAQPPHDSPDTVNPSLWRHTQLNHICGLFEVTPGIYQVRGYDMANITFIKGDTGWIVIDPLMTIETARAALQLVNEHLGERPIMAIIYSHTHIDHFGGVKGIVTEEEVHARKIPIIAPVGFEEYAVSENLYAGTAMGRRAEYQYGTMLEPSATGRMSIGIGMGQSTGTTSYLPPMDGRTLDEAATVKESGETRVIDGVKMVFQLTPGTEAPAEMNTWFPDHKALWMAENCNATLHNLYTIRGAQVRDGNAWAYHLMETLSLYGAQADVLFQSHNWPRWGNEVIQDHLLNTATMYKFTNDQVLLYINQGYTAEEIAHMIQLPTALECLWYLRPYYGTLAHNAKAVYQKYMGWYDANPVNLGKLPRAEFAQKLVAYLGDVDKMLAMARADFEQGEYQWVAEITNVLVFANPDNREARELCADAFEQLGYQTESGIWRNAYLCGAKELREGVSHKVGSAGAGVGDMQRGLQPAMVFDYMGIRVDSNQAQDLNFKIQVDVVGDDACSGRYVLTVRSGVLLHQRVTGDVTADAGVTADVVVTLPRQAIGLLLAPEQLLEQARIGQHVSAVGDVTLLQKLYQSMVELNPLFNIIEP